MDKPQLKVPIWVRFIVWVFKGWMDRFDEDYPAYIADRWHAEVTHITPAEMRWTTYLGVYPDNISAYYVARAHAFLEAVLDRTRRDRIEWKIWRTLQPPRLPECNATW